MRKKPILQADRATCALPARRELNAVLHGIHAQRIEIRSGLDIGFTNAGISRILRQCGGYWMTVEPTPRRQALVATALEADTVLLAGRHGELPFEDKQFDVVALAYGMLPGDEEGAKHQIRECHRVLRSGGILIMTVEHRARHNLAAAFCNRKSAMTEEMGRHSEADIFHLMKGGFDVLGFRYTCRFWVQLVRNWTACRRREGMPYGATTVWLNACYAVAQAMDLPLIFSKGHQMTVYGRRKGWREKHSRVMSGNVPVSNAILFDPRREGSQASLARFK